MTIRELYAHGIKGSAPFLARMLQPIDNRKVSFCAGQFLAEMKPTRSQIILDLGGPGRITSVVKESCKADVISLNISMEQLRSKGPSGIMRVLGDGLRLPLKNSSVDFVLADNLIEHIPRKSRRSFALECRRVARRGLFLTTPNYWFPFEPHYFIPFFQYLPHMMRKWILGKTNLGWIKRGFYEEIDLLSSRELQSLFPEAHVRRWMLEGLILYEGFYHAASGSLRLESAPS